MSVSVRTMSLAVRRLRRPGDHVLRPFFAPTHARAASVPGDASALVDDPGHQHLAQKGDHARSADAERRQRPLRCSTWARAVLGSIHTSSIAPADGAHARGGAGSFEGGSRRAGAGDQPVGVAQHHLAVGAHVDEEADRLFLVHARAQHPAVISPPTYAPTAGRQSTMASGCMCRPSRAAGTGGKRPAAGMYGSSLMWCGLQPQEQVDHGGVAGHHGQRDLLRRQALSGQHLVHQGVDGGDDPFLQLRG